MHSFLPTQGAGMRWTGWLAAVAVVACGGKGPGSNSSGTGSSVPDAGPGDAGPADAGPPADCIGIVPASKGTAYTFDVSGAGTSGSCSGSAGDGAGTMAAGIVWAGEIPEWHEYDAAGNSTGGSFRAESALPQPAGFVGVMQDGQGNRSLAHWDLYGNQGVQISIDANAVVAPAWHGGALVLSANAGGMKVRRFDANAVEVASTTIAGTFTVLGAGDDKSGLVLALIATGSDVRAMWVDIAKGWAGDSYPIGTGSDVMARPLATGGVAVRIGGHWIAFVDPMNPPQAFNFWQRAGTSVSLVRGEKAYALSAGNAIDLVSTQGNFCGSLTFAGMSDVSVGLDGTVIGSTGTKGCTKVFWSELLK